MMIQQAAAFMDPSAGNICCVFCLCRFLLLSLLSANPRLASGGNAPSRGSIAARGLALIKVGPVEEAPRGWGEKGA